MMTTVGPGELLKALTAATPGDTLDIYGVQPLGGRLTNTKHVTLTNGKGQRATLQGAITDQAGLFIDGGQDPFAGFILDDDTQADTIGHPSWIINSPGVAWQGVELTNRKSKIGLHPNDYGKGGANFTISFAYIHAIGRRYPSATAAGSQAVAREPGVWVDNHDQGFYGSGTSGITVQDVLIEDCANRGMQFRAGASGARIKRVLVRDCGMGFIFGDPCSDIQLADSILLDNRCAKRTLLEEYNPGSGNGVSNVVAFNHDGRKASALTSVHVTNLREIDPLYDPATRKLATGSPAVGLGPSFIQPGVVTQPPPVTVPDIPAAVTATDLAIKELELSTAWARYSSSPSTHTFKAHAAMVAARKALSA